ncbi:hypothetical protein MNBD_GAMMA03-12 [hydrothermal vent metagenome]|uniref:Acyltransferase 3 domain-containing protein n=1 Tax=hydrothermal vent metagenome TaxID=652676 RepID=A0A3B0WEY5_9ZZZZ
MNFNLKKDDTLAIKGIAIILIILHNFYHNIRLLPSQNEFSFSINKTLSLINIFKSEYSDILRALFSYFGHYGVQLFIFLSAYGLTKKYLTSNSPYRNIFLHSYFKILVPFIFVLFLWIAHELLIAGKSINFIMESYGAAIILKFLAINIPGYALSPVGPWWFYPTIIQFYLLFPILLKLYSKHGIPLLIIITFLSMTLLMVFNKKILFFNVIGHLPELCLGMLLASYKNFDFKKRYILGIAIIFILGQFNYYLWFFGRSSFVLLVLFLYKTFNFKKAWLINTGKVSLFAFLINGFLRDPFFSLIDNSGNSSYIIILIGLIYLIYILMLSFLLDSIYTKTKRALNSDPL